MTEVSNLKLMGVEIRDTFSQPYATPWWHASALPSDHHALKTALIGCFFHYDNLMEQFYDPDTILIADRYHTNTGRLFEKQGSVVVQDLKLAHERGEWYPSDYISVATYNWSMYGNYKGPKFRVPCNLLHPEDVCPWTMKLRKPIKRDE